MSTEPRTETEPIYSPSALLHVFNNSLNIPQVKRMISVRGIYMPGNNQVYTGVYYDSIRDEALDMTMTLIVPALIRNRLQSNTTITLIGYISKKVSNYGRIDLQINLVELVEQSHNKYSEEEIRALEIQRQKAINGYRDVDSFLKKKIVSNEKVRIKILIGKTAIIDSDIKDQLAEAVNFYDISFDKASFTSEVDIINAIHRNDVDAVDILVVSRGGGENLDTFDKPNIAEKCLQLKPMLITAIGHKENTPLLEKIADKSFIVPAVFGRYLNDMYNDTIQELQQSKARLVDDITNTLKANFDKQIQNLNEQLKASELQKQQLLHDLKQVTQKEKEGIEQVNTEKINVLNQTIRSINEQQKAKEDIINNYKRQVQGLQSQLQLKPERETNWTVIILSIVIGLIIGLIIARR